MGNAIKPEQSLPICGALSAVGGILEVFATAVLAYPAARAQEGVVWSKAWLRGCLAINLILQIVASLAGNLFATWFGPVSIVGPIFFAAQLVANLVIFWIVLGLENFTKDMQIGTYVIVVAVTLLVRVGPQPQDNQDFEDLMLRPYSLAWSGLLLGGMFYTSIYVFCIDLKSRGSEFFRILILLACRSTSFALNLTAGRALILNAGKEWIILTTVIKVVSGAIYTKAVVVQSTAVSQAIFVPINAATIMLVNAITGIIIWEDWRVVDDWTGYVCVFLLLALGCTLLLGDLQLLNEANPEAFRPRYALLRQKGRRQMMENIIAFGDESGPCKSNHDEEMPSVVVPFWTHGDHVDDGSSSSDDDEDDDRIGEITPSDRTKSQHASSGRRHRAQSFVLHGIAQRRSTRTAWAHLYNIPHVHDDGCHDHHSHRRHQFGRRRPGSIYSWAPNRRRSSHAPSSDVLRPLPERTMSEQMVKRPKLATIESESSATGGGSSSSDINPRANEQPRRSVSAPPPAKSSAQMRSKTIGKGRMENFEDEVSSTSGRGEPAQHGGSVSEDGAQADGDGGNDGPQKQDSHSGE